MLSRYRPSLGMARFSTPLLCLLLLAGCEGCGDEAEQNGPATGGSGGGEGTTGEEAPESNVPVDPGPAPELGLAVEPGRDGATSLIVDNRGEEPVRLATALSLERQDGEAFTAVEGIGGLALRFDCTTPPEECVTLIPGAALHPPPWSGDLGDAQCDCERCADAPTGTYRFVVTTCGGGHRVQSPAFER